MAILPTHVRLVPPTRRTTGPGRRAFKAAQGTAKPAKWRNLGRDERLVWGECQGSGSTPYQVRVDLVDVTYKCSCPSRKLPCRHTLGLLLMVAGGRSQSPPSPQRHRLAADNSRESEELSARLQNRDS